jgi:hypothetical protein
MRALLVVLGLVWAGLIVSYFTVLLPRHRRLLLGAIEVGRLPAAWIHYTKFPPQFTCVSARERGNVPRLTWSLLRTPGETPALESARRQFVRAWLGFGVALAVLAAACIAILTVR